MEIREKRKAVGHVEIDQALIQHAAAQLRSELEILEGWFADLERHGSGDQMVIDTKVAYNDMLRSRKEMLEAVLSLEQPTP